MASPAQDIPRVGQRLKKAVEQPMDDSDVMAVGQTASTLRNAPVATPVARPWDPSAPKVTAPSGASVSLLDKMPFVRPKAAPLPTIDPAAVPQAAGPRGSVLGIEPPPLPRQPWHANLRLPSMLQGMGAAVGILPEGVRTGSVFTHPNATWNDVGAQAAEGFGRFGSAGSGASLGATVGSVAGPVGSLALGLLGGVGGYLAGDKAIRGLRAYFNGDARSPDEQLDVRAPGTKATLTEPALRPPALPTPAPALPQADYSNEGRNYPTPDVAPGLRPPDLSGKIIRNGNNYSGSDIKFGEDILDKNGKLVNGGDPNNPKGFGVTSLDTSAGYRADLAELGRLRAEAAERAAGFAANQPGGGLMGFSPRTLVDDVVARHGQSGSGSSSSPRLRERIAMAELAERRAANQAATAATLRGQDINAGVARESNAERRYATDVGASTARRGQDMDYNEKLDARMLDLAAKKQLRDMTSAAVKAAGGKMRDVAAIQLANGLDPSAAISVDRLDSDNTAARAKALDKAVEAQSVDPVTGKVSEGQLALNRSAVKKTIRGLDGMSPEQLAAVEPEVNSVAKLRNGFNALRRTSLTQRLGLSNAPVESDELPDLTGYTPKRLGKTANWDPTIDAKQGDWELSHPSKPSLYLPGSVTSFDADMLAKYRGLRLPPN